MGFGCGVWVPRSIGSPVASSSPKNQNDNRAARLRARLCDRTTRSDVSPRCILAHNPLRHFLLSSDALDLPMLVHVVVDAKTDSTGLGVGGIAEFSVVRILHSGNGIGT